MNYADYLTTTHSGPIDYRGYSAQYRPQNSSIYSHSVQQPYRPRSLTRVSESSSGIEIVDEETSETHSSDSEPSIIQYHSPSSSSSSLSSRRVVINSNDQTVTISNKRRPRQRRRNRKNQWSKSPTKQRSFNKSETSQYSSKYKHQHSSSKQREYQEDRLKHLFDKYSNEDIDRQWKPLTFLESRELYQYAVDKYHKKSRYN